ncbi:hypothetical protein [Paenibacillus herberti]|uniref:WYL domain-containing protein n=1 Tax=Paenibacillus herberti TaxID=1619309 RepID=A0A229NZ10_9BACL|nr:hypothetical protein [Paenibacillus herberti]OXM15087.1 hypothetical protein CGZ75_14600 [Paenibacillus herberti]
MNIGKWIGRNVELIYTDASGRFTRRLVRLLHVNGDVVAAYDLLKRQPRTFRLEGILAIQPAGRVGRERLG